MVLLDVFAEAADEAFGLFLRRGVEALAGDSVHGDDVDDLIGLLPRIGDGVAQRGFVERFAGFERELGAGPLEEGGIDLVRAGAGNAGGLFRDDIGIEGAQQGGGEFGESLAAGELGELGAARGVMARSSRARRRRGEVETCLRCDRRMRRAEHLLEGDGGLAVERVRLGLVALADADGIDDDEVGLVAWRRA